MVLASVMGDLWDWIAGVFTRIGDVSPYWLVVALALKSCESALLGLTWRNILRAAYPKGGLTVKTAWGASQGGTATTALAPVPARSAGLPGLLRSHVCGRVRGRVSRVAALDSSAVRS